MARASSDPPGQGGSPPGLLIPATATVVVDCDAGESIQAALETPAIELTIEIEGVCTENVVVERDHVAFRGGDPAIDGVTSAAAAASGVSTFGVRDGDFVTIENLLLTGGFGGLEIRNSVFVDITDCVIEGNSFAGAFVGPAARATFTDVFVTGNGVRGFQVEGATVFRCTDCTVEAPAQGLVARDAARVTLDGGSYEARVAVRADGPADIVTIATQLEGIAVSGFGLAIDISDGAIATVNGGTLVGPIHGSNNGQINLHDVVQTIPPDFSVSNLLRGGATLRTSTFGGGGTSLDGDLDIIEFSRGVFRLPTTIGGSLSCSAAGDAFCDDPTSTVVGTSNCGYCLHP